MAKGNSSWVSQKRLRSMCTADQSTCTWLRSTVARESDWASDLRQLDLGEHALLNERHAEPLPGALLRLQARLELLFADRTALQEQLADSFPRHQGAD